jgi:hypothetical protein
VVAGRLEQAVWHVQQTLNVSQRRACRVLSQPRRTRRYEPRRGGDEGKLVRRMLEWVRAHPRYGSSDPGVAASGGLASEPQADLAAVEAGRPEGAAEKAQEAFW